MVTHMTNSVRRFCGPFLSAAIGLGVAGSTLTGCTVEEHTYASGHVDDDYEAVSYEPAYQHAQYVHEYRGRPTYYVSGRWYFRNGNTWHAYRREPAELGR